MRYPTTPTAILRATIAGCALLFGLAACGGADPSQPTSQPANPTAVPTAVPASPPPEANPPASQPPANSQPGDQLDPIDAIAAVIDYYAAISDQRYQEAYAFWADGGAASQQTAEQFAAGFASTAGIKLDLGPREATSVDPDRGRVLVPVSVTAITNDAGGSQSVHQYGGSYTLAPRDGTWEIIDAHIVENANPDLPAPDFSDPAATLRSYYAAIDGGDYGSAFTHWGDNGSASQQSFEEFAAGFAGTGSVSVSLGQPALNAGAGSAYADIPAVIFVTTTQGAQQTFCGTYSLRKANVPPFDQFGWRIERAAIAATANVAPDSPEAGQLLAGGCR